MNYLQKDNWAHLLNCWCLINSPYKVLYMQQSHIIHWQACFFFFFFLRKTLISLTSFFFGSLSLLFWSYLVDESLDIFYLCNIFTYVKRNLKKLLEDVKMLQVTFTMIYIIHKISVLPKITRISKCFLKSTIDFYFSKNNSFHNIYLWRVQGLKNKT